jgi:hypothetical protein
MILLPFGPAFWALSFTTCFSNTQLVARGSKLDGCERSCQHGSSKRNAAPPNSNRPSLQPLKQFPNH